LIQWLPVSYPTDRPPKPPMSTVATQTVGLYFPSEKQIVKKKEQEEDKQAFEKQMRDRRPLLTSVSPGKGWLYQQKFEQLFYIFDKSNLMCLIGHWKNSFLSVSLTEFFG